MSRISRRPAGAAVLLCLGLLAASCSRMRGPSLLGDDALMTAPDRDFLAERLALVAAGRYIDAHEQWAARALLPPERAESALPESGEQAWSRDIGMASAALAESGATARGLERLGRAYARAGWYKEAHTVLARALDRGGLSAAGEELFLVTTTIARFAAGADSVMAADRARADRGGSPRAAADVLALAGRLGLESDALRARRLYLGLRPVPGGGDLRDVELAVIASHEGPFPLRLDGAAVTARRAILDDNAISRTGGGEGGDWDPGSLTLVEAGTLIAYHHRSDLRRAAARLFSDLERRGGRPPDSPADSSLAALATALRLRAASPLFDRARATGTTRREVRRLFVRDVMAARMAQVEVAGARHLLDERQNAGVGGQAGAERRLLAVLRHGPLPGLALADAADRAAHPAGAGDEEAAAARAVMEKLRANAAISGISGASAAGPAILLHLGEERLRDLAAGAD